METVYSIAGLLKWRNYIIHFAKTTNIPIHLFLCSTEEQEQELSETTWQKNETFLSFDMGKWYLSKFGFTWIWRFKNTKGRMQGDIPPRRASHMPVRRVRPQNRNSHPNGVFQIHKGTCFTTLGDLIKFLTSIPVAFALTPPRKPPQLPKNNQWHKNTPLSRLPTRSINTKAQGLTCAQWNLLPLSFSSHLLFLFSLPPLVFVFLPPVFLLSLCLSDWNCKFNRGPNLQKLIAQVTSE